MKRKIYNELLKWKKENNGEVALLIDGARRIGKSYIVEQFAKEKEITSVMISLSYDTDYAVAYAAAECAAF